MLLFTLLLFNPLENLVIDIVKGKTVGEAFQRCKDLLQENIKKCPSLGYDFAIPYLTSNYESLVLFGSEDTKIN